MFMSLSIREKAFVKCPSEIALFDIPSGAMVKLKDKSHKETQMAVVITTMKSHDDEMLPCALETMLNSQVIKLLFSEFPINVIFSEPLMER